MKADELKHLVKRIEEVESNPEFCERVSALLFLKHGYPLPKDRDEGFYKLIGIDWSDCTDEVMVLAVGTLQGSQWREVIEYEKLDESYDIESALKEMKRKREEAYVKRQADDERREFEEYLRLKEKFETSNKRESVIQEGFDVELRTGQGNYINGVVKSVNDDGSKIRILWYDDGTCEEDEVRPGNKIIDGRWGAELLIKDRSGHVVGKNGFAMDPDTRLG